MGNYELKHRLRQFFLGVAIDTGIIKKNMSEVDELLSDIEKKLFYKMQKHDQFHAFRVYKNIIDNKEELNLSDFELLVLKKAALLHDVGRNKENSNILKKAWSVIIIYLVNRMPKAKQKQYKLKVLTTKKMTALYVYLQHPYIGYDLLKNKARLDDDTLWLIKNHHNNNHKSNKLLSILQKYDKLE